MVNKIRAGGRKRERVRGGDKGVTVGERDMEKLNTRAEIKKIIESGAEKSEWVREREGETEKWIKKARKRGERRWRGQRVRKTSEKEIEWV